MPCWCWPPIAREGSRGAFGRRHAGGRAGPLVLRRDAPLPGASRLERQACVPLEVRRGCVCIPRCAGAVGLETDGWLVAEVLRFGCHTVTPLLVALGGENGIGALGVCRAGVGRFSRVRAREGGLGRRHAGGRAGPLGLRSDAPARCVAP